MGNIYGAFVSDGTNADDVAAGFKRAEEWRESAGHAELAGQHMRALEAVLARMNEPTNALCVACLHHATERDESDCRDFRPERVTLEAVWNLPADHQFSAPSVYADVPKRWPRCLARAVFSGYVEDYFLTEDGLWLHPDQWAFGRYMLPLGYELVSKAGEVLSGVIEVLRPGEYPEAAACRLSGTDGWVGFGTDPTTGLTAIAAGHPGRLRGIGWSMRITSAEGSPWTRR